MAFLEVGRFVCHACGRRFNERTGTLLNDCSTRPTSSSPLCSGRLRYKLSLWGPKTPSESKGACCFLCEGFGRPFLSPVGPCQ